MANGCWTDAEPLGDVLVLYTFGDQSNDLVLTFGEFGDLVCCCHGQLGEIRSGSELGLSLTTAETCKNITWRLISPKCKDPCNKLFARTAKVFIASKKNLR